jgi:hypothetical protein
LGDGFEPSDFRWYCENSANPLGRVEMVTGSILDSSGPSLWSFPSVKQHMFDEIIRVTFLH